MKNALILCLVGFVLVAIIPRAQTAPTAVPIPASEVKADFLRLIDRPRVALDVRKQEVKAPFHHLITEKLDFASQILPSGMVERVPVIVVRPEEMTGRMPVVIVLHGTGGKKEGNWTWLEQLAHRGFIAVSIDGRYHGERNGGKPGTTAYNEAVYRAFMSTADQPQTHPFFFDTCWDVMRTVDYLISRPDVDADRIGLMGISKGGIETYLTAAVDERIKVVVPAIAMQSFRWGLTHNRWQARANTIQTAHEMVAADLGQPEVNAQVCQVLWAKVVPGIRDEFDGPSMVRLLAGRPLLILNGENDPNCPIQGAELAFSAARAAFHDADASDRLKIMVAQGVGHTVSPEQHQAALDWFVTWLKPVTPPSTARYLFRKTHPTGPLPEAQLADGTAPAPRPHRPEHPRPSRRPFGRRNVASFAPVVRASEVLAEPTDVELTASAR